MNILEKVERQQLIAYIETLVNEELITEQDIVDYFSPQPLTEEQTNIVVKLKEKNDLTLEEKEIISVAIQPKQNIKAKSLLKGKSAFVKFLVEYKLDTMFNVLWKNYPRKVSMQVSKKAFIKLFSELKYKDLDKVFVELRNRLQSYIYSCQGKDQQFILHFSTWLNQKRWNDKEW